MATNLQTTCVRMPVRTRTRDRASANSWGIWFGDLSVRPPAHAPKFTGNPRVVRTYVRTFVGRAGPDQLTKRRFVSLHGPGQLTNRRFVSWPGPFQLTNRRFVSGPGLANLQIGDL